MCEALASLGGSRADVLTPHLPPILKLIQKFTHDAPLNTHKTKLMVGTRGNFLKFEFVKNMPCILCDCCCKVIELCILFASNLNLIFCTDFEIHLFFSGYISDISDASVPWSCVVQPS